MRKREELSNPNSCINKAADEEIVFVLRGHDLCAPETIQFWINLRIKSGKNELDDPQIREAAACAEIMRQERG